MARTEGTQSAASSAANTTSACSPSGSATDAPPWGRGTAVCFGAPRMIIIRSSYDPTSATAGHAATAAPIMPWPRPWATFAGSIAIMPKPSSHRASEGTRTRHRAESASPSNSHRSARPPSGGSGARSSRTRRAPAPAHSRARTTPPPRQQRRRAQPAPSTTPTCTSPVPPLDPAATLPLISAGTFRPGSATGPRPPSSRQAATGSTSLGPGRAPQIPGVGHPSPQPCRPRHPTGSGRADPRPAAIDPGLSTCRGVRDRVAACTLSALSAVMPENIHSGS
jgi:hypothetical protein